MLLVSVQFWFPAICILSSAVWFLWSKYTVIFHKWKITPPDNILPLFTPSWLRWHVTCMWVSVKPLLSSSNNPLVPFVKPIGFVEIQAVSSHTCGFLKNRPYHWRLTHWPELSKNSLLSWSCTSAYADFPHLLFATWETRSDLVCRHVCRAAVGSFVFPGKPDFFPVEVSLIIQCSTIDRLSM